MRILTDEQAKSVINVAFDGIQFFNPVKDATGRFFISEEEVNQCTNEEFMWVKELEQSEFIPPISNLLK